MDKALDRANYVRRYDRNHKVARECEMRLLVMV
jgi:hypothetical protein